MRSRRTTTRPSAMKSSSEPSFCFLYLPCMVLVPHSMLQLPVAQPVPMFCMFPVWMACHDWTLQ